MLSRRTLLARATHAAVAACCIALGANRATAQDYPTKPVQLIVPFAAGGAADIIGRTIAEKLSQTWGQQVVVENRAGPDRISASTLPPRAPPMVTRWCSRRSPWPSIRGFSSRCRTIPWSDLTPLTLALETPNVVLVPPSSPIKNIKDLIAFAKEKAASGGATYGSAGVGSSLHLAAEVFRQQAKVEMTHVPYRGSSPALTDLMAGRIDLMFDNASTALPQVQGGSLRAIAVTTEERIAALPDVPTISEIRAAGLRARQLVGHFWSGPDAAGAGGAHQRRYPQGSGRSGCAEAFRRCQRARHRVVAPGTCCASGAGKRQMEADRRDGRHSRQPVTTDVRHTRRSITNEYQAMRRALGLRALDGE